MEVTVEAQRRHDTHGVMELTLPGDHDQQKVSLKQLLTLGTPAVFKGPAPPTQLFDFPVLNPQASVESQRTTILFILG